MSGDQLDQADKTHRDDAMNRRCNGCERIVRLCICGEVSR